ncbi:MAG: DUF1318 domain-containing protein [Candidatus Omnitrophica bacterium]|nr:DUF1318 domain-containing protein [Candidatus Omnitrophota bacterium]
MKKILLLMMIAAAIGFGCARVNVGGSKEPIKVDIAMRLDIYQHVQKDIDSIENIVAGDKAKTGKKPGDQSWLNFAVAEVYAQEGLSPDVEQAALRRKDRRSSLDSWEAQGVVGENKLGLVEIKNSKQVDSAVRDLVQVENADRMLIYRSLAQKYGESLEQIEKVYAEKLAAQAPSGTPVESLNGEWKVK